MLVVYNRFISKIVKRDDPFSISNIFAIIIFIVILQKYLVELVCMSVFGSEDKYLGLFVVIR